MFIINLWYFAILASPIILVVYGFVKKKYMTWRDVLWFIYGILVASFPAYVMWTQYLR